MPVHSVKLALVAGALMQAGSVDARQSQYSASIVRTTYGIPHITARDWRGAGYGVGYAYAQDNLCMIAEEFATVAGERSLHFGPKGTAVLRPPFLSRIKAMPNIPPRKKPLNSPTAHVPHPSQPV